VGEFFSTIAAKTELGLPTDREDKQLRALVTDRLSFEFLKKAVQTFADRPNGFGGLTKISSWGLFLKDGARLVKQAQTICTSDHGWRMQHDPEYKAAQDASIARQTAEVAARMQYTPPVNEQTMEEFMS
jgi:hypothetical protein